MLSGMFIGFLIGLTRFIGFTGFAGFTRFMGFMGFMGFRDLGVWGFRLEGLRGFTG